MIQVIKGWSQKGYDLSYRNITLYLGKLRISEIDIDIYIYRYKNEAWELVVIVIVEKAIFEWGHTHRIVGRINLWADHTGDKPENIAISKQPGEDLPAE